MFDPKAAAATRMARRRFEARDLLDRIKSGPCEECGLKFKPCQMDLVRKDGRRTVPVAQMLHLSKQRILDEAALCHLMCANCSRLLSWERERTGRAGDT